MIPPVGSTYESETFVSPPTYIPLARLGTSKDSLETPSKHATYPVYSNGNYLEVGYYKLIGTKLARKEMTRRM
jgi:hypothetical protein